MDGRERVELNAVLLQQREAGHDFVECRLPAFVDAVGIVQVSRPVDAQSDEKFVFCEKFAPLVVEQRAVGLKRVFDRAALGVASLEFNDVTKKVQAGDRRFTALPRKTDDGARLRGDVIAHVGFEHFRRHAEVALARVEMLLLQVEAVSAVEITLRPHRLGHEVEWRASGVHGKECEGGKGRSQTRAAASGAR